MDKKVTSSERVSGRAWYVVHTFSGYEKKVKATLESKIAAQGLENVIFDVIVPMRDESEFKDGRRRIVKKKVFPGYVLVDMIVDNSSQYARCYGLCRLRKRSYSAKRRRSPKNFDRAD